MKIRNLFANGACLFSIALIVSTGYPSSAIYAEVPVIDEIPPSANAVIVDQAPSISKSDVSINRDEENAGYRYEHSYSSKSSKTTFDHHVSNPSSATDQVSYAVSVTHSASANVTVDTTFNSMVANVGLSTQVGLGKSITKTYTIVWNIPPKSSWRLRAGNRWVKAVGREEYVNNQGKVVKFKDVTGNWSYQTWNDKIKQ